MAEVSRSRTLAPGARQPWYRRPRLQFTAQAVLLLAIVLGMVSQVVSSRREAEELLHVNGVAADLVRLSGDLWDVETGARRYVLTGRDAWLAPYHAAVRDIDERTGHLRTLTQDDPVTAGALAHFTAAKDRELAAHRPARSRCGAARARTLRWRRFAPGSATRRWTRCCATSTASWPTGAIAGPCWPSDSPTGRRGSRASWRSGPRSGSSCWSGATGRSSGPRTRSGSRRTRSRRSSTDSSRASRSRPRTAVS